QGISLGVHRGLLGHSCADHGQPGHIRAPEVDVHSHPALLASVGCQKGGDLTGRPAPGVGASCNAATVQLGASKLWLMRGVEGALANSTHLRLKAPDSGEHARLVVGSWRWFHDFAIQEPRFWAGMVVI